MVRRYLLGTGININQNDFKNLPQAGSLSIFAKRI